MIIKKSWKDVRKNGAYFAVFAVAVLLLSAAQGVLGHSGTHTIDVTQLPSDIFDLSMDDSFNFTNIKVNTTIILKFSSTMAFSCNLTSLDLELSAFPAGINYVIMQLFPKHNDKINSILNGSSITLQAFSIPAGESFTIDDDCFVHGTTVPGRFSIGNLTEEDNYYPYEARLSFNPKLNHSISLDTDVEMPFFTMTNGSISVFDVINDDRMQDPVFPLDLPAETECVIIQSKSPDDFKLTVSTTMYGNPWCPALNDSWLRMENIRLTDTEYNSSSPQIATGENGNIFMVWKEQIDEGNILCFKKSQDFGFTWLTESVIRNAEEDIRTIVFDADGPSLAVAWEEGSYVYVIHSSDGGGNWTEPYRAAPAFEPSITMEGDSIFLAYRGFRVGGADMWFYIKLIWTANGMEEISQYVFTHPDGLEYMGIPEVTVNGNFVHVAIGDFTTRSIHYWSSIDNGISWMPVNILADYSGKMVLGQLRLIRNETRLVMLWSDNRTGSYQIYQKYTDDKGVTWSDDIQLTSELRNAVLPNGALDANGTLHLVWTDVAEFNGENVENGSARYKAIQNSGIFFTSEFALTDVVADSVKPDVAVDRNGHAHIVWEDYRLGNSEIYYLNIGAANINASDADASSSLASPSAGEEITLSATFSNNGDGDLYNVYVNFYVMSEPTLVASTYVPIFYAHTTQTFTTTWIAESGNHTMVATVDSDTDLENGYITKIEHPIFVNTPPTAVIDAYQNYEISAALIHGDVIVEATILEDNAITQQATLNNDNTTFDVKALVGNSYYLNYTAQGNSRTTMIMQITISRDDQVQTYVVNKRLNPGEIYSGTLFLNPYFELISQVSPTYIFDSSSSTDSDDGIRTVLWDFGDGLSLAPTTEYTFVHHGHHDIVLTISDHNGLIAQSNVDIYSLASQPQTSNQDIKDYHSYGFDGSGFVHAIGEAASGNDVLYSNNRIDSVQWSNEIAIVNGSFESRLLVSEKTDILYTVWLTMSNPRQLYFTTSADGQIWYEPRFVATLPYMVVTDMDISMTPENLQVIISQSWRDYSYYIPVDFDNDGILDQDDIHPTDFDMNLDTQVTGDASNSTLDGSASVLIDYVDVNNTDAPTITSVVPQVPLANSIGQYYDVNAVGPLTAYIKIKYDPSQLPSNINEASLRMYHFDGSVWQICASPSLGDITGIDLETNTVWAKIHSLSVFTAADASMIDSDGDGLYDLWETEYGLEPNTATSEEDPDGDTLVFSVEQYYGTDPYDNNTDKDGLNDNEEIYNYWILETIPLETKFFSTTSETYLDISRYSTGSNYRIIINGTAYVNSTTWPLIENAFKLCGIMETDLYWITLTQNLEIPSLTDEWVEVSISYSGSFTKEGFDKLWLAANEDNFDDRTYFQITPSIITFMEQGSDPTNAFTYDLLLSDGTKTSYDLGIWSLDTDQDRFCDWAEAVYWYTVEKLSWNDVWERTNNTQDWDADGLSDGQEVYLHTLPTVADYDNDGLNDFEEAGQFIPLYTQEISPGFSLFDVDLQGEYSVKITTEEVISNYDATDYDFTDGIFLATNSPEEQQAEYIANDISSDNTILTTGLDIFSENTNCAVVKFENISSEFANITVSRYYIGYMNLTTGSYQASLNTESTNTLEADGELNIIKTKIVVSRRWLDPFNSDVDDDGLLDGNETKLGSNPWVKDSDGDGLLDGPEVFTYGTHPAKPDTDGDRLLDGLNVDPASLTGLQRDYYDYSLHIITEEIEGVLLYLGELESTMRTNPRLNDTDNDGLYDGDEYEMGCNATNVDTDDDTMPDGWEDHFSLDPTSPLDMDGDMDGDLLLNAQEYTAGTLPNDPDSDHDRLSDRYEITELFFRTNITDGAISSEYYTTQASATNWINLNYGEKVNYSYYMTLNDPPASVVMSESMTSLTQYSTADTRNEKVLTLEDGTGIFARWNSTDITEGPTQEIYGEDLLRFDGENWIAQSFIMESDCIDSVTLDIQPIHYVPESSITQTMIVEIREDNLGIPGPDVLTTSSLYFAYNGGGGMPNPSQSWDEAFELFGEIYEPSGALPISENPENLEMMICIDEDDDGLYWPEDAEDNNHVYSNDGMNGYNAVDVSQALSGDYSILMGIDQPGDFNREFKIWVNGSELPGVESRNGYCGIAGSVPDENGIYSEEEQTFSFPESGTVMELDIQLPGKGGYVFDLTDLRMDPGTKYWFVVRMKPEETAPRMLSAYSNPDLDAYVPGACLKGTQGTRWTEIQDTDLSFTINGYNNPVFDQVLVWTPGSDSGDADGNAILEGAVHIFKSNDSTPFPILDPPFVGFHNREIYRGSSPVLSDTDGDEIPDADEISNSTDSDLDGLQNNCDKDSDNDGLLDGEEIEWAADSDSDGKKNMIDPDSDNDGVSDGRELLWYTDNDGDELAGMIDDDSDGDGLVDGINPVTQIGEDLNCNGKIEAGETNSIDADTDSDGITDWDEIMVLGNGLSDIDTDDDRIINALDSDSDGDRLPDGKEVRVLLRTNAVNAEFNSSCWVSIVTDPQAWAVGPIVTDINWDMTVFNYTPQANTLTSGYIWAAINGIILEISFNGNELTIYDTIRDISTYFHAESNVNASTSQFPEPTFAKKVQEKLAWVQLTDDSISNVLDEDSDNDGLLDGMEDANGNGLTEPYEADPFIADSDDDSILDGEELDWDHDTDSDGSINALDKDSDGDGLEDRTETLRVVGNVVLTPGTSMVMADTDGDNLWDGLDAVDRFGANRPGEQSMSTCPTDIDTDDDGLLDGYSTFIGDRYYLGELSLGTNPVTTGVLNGPDSDEDGLWDGLEVGLYYYNSTAFNIITDLNMSWGMLATDISVFQSDMNFSTTTDPTRIDTDFDDLPDGWIDGWSNEATDGIRQTWEGEDLSLNGKVDTWMGMNETSPGSYDSDKDGLNDTAEVSSGTYWFTLNSPYSNIALLATQVLAGTYSISVLVEATGNGLLSLENHPETAPVLVNSRTGWTLLTANIILTAGETLDIFTTSGVIMAVLISTPVVIITESWSNVPLGSNQTIDIPSGYYVEDASIEFTPVSRYNGTILGAEWSSGKIGNAMVFDGVNDYVNVPHRNTLNITRNITIEMWFKLDTIKDNQFQNLISKRYNSDYTTPYMVGIDSRLTSGYSTSQPGITFLLGEGTSCAMAKTPPLNIIGTWVHFVGRVSGNIVQIFINGVESGTSDTFSGTRQYNFDPVIIGHGGGYPEDYFNGSIDELRILNKALSQQEILEDFKSTGGYPIRSNTSAWYSFDDFNRSVPTRVYDISGMNNTGTAYNNPSRTAISGSAMKFDGTGYVGIPSGENNLNGFTQYSIELWFNRDTFDVWDDIFSFWDGDNTHMFRLEEGGASNLLVLYNNAQGKSLYWDNLQDDTWYHVAIVFTGVLLKMYINGTLVDEEPCTTPPTMDNGNWYIGCRYPVVETFRGKVDEFRILNRSLSDKEVLEDYNATGQYPFRNGTVAWYHFDEGVGIYANDSNYVQNLTLSIGNETVPIWIHPGSLTQTITAEFLEDYFNQQVNKTTGELLLSFSALYGGIIGSICVTIIAMPIRTNPTSKDSDEDGLNDWYEVNFYGTNPLSWDTDDDMLNDYEEIMNQTGTNPALRDTDYDGLWDGFYDQNGNGAFDPCTEVGEDVNLNYTVDSGETDPRDPDDDNDGLVDGVERIPGILWFEAEDYATGCYYDAYALSNVTDGGVYVPVIGDSYLMPMFEDGSWKLYVRVKGNYTTDQEVCNVSPSTALANINNVYQELPEEEVSSVQQYYSTDMDVIFGTQVGNEISEIEISTNYIAESNVPATDSPVRWSDNTYYGITETKSTADAVYSAYKVWSLFSPSSLQGVKLGTIMFEGMTTGETFQVYINAPGVIPTSGATAGTSADWLPVQGLLIGNTGELVIPSTNTISNTAYPGEIFICIKDTLIDFQTPDTLNVNRLWVHWSWTEYYDKLECLWEFDITSAYANPSLTIVGSVVTDLHVDGFDIYYSFDEEGDTPDTFHQANKNSIDETMTSIILPLGMVPDDYIGIIIIKIVDSSRTPVPYQCAPSSISIDQIYIWDTLYSSHMEYYWEIMPESGFIESIDVCAWKVDDGVDFDNFRFEYSVDNDTFYEMFTVSNVIDSEVYEEALAAGELSEYLSTFIQSYIPKAANSTVFIRVTDTDDTLRQTLGTTHLFVDLLRINVRNFEDFDNGNDDVLNWVITGDAGVTLGTIPDESPGLLKLSSGGSANVPIVQPTRDDYIVSFDYFWPVATTMTGFTIFNAKGKNDVVILNIYQTDMDKLYVVDKDGTSNFATLSCDFWHYFDIYFVSDGTYRIYIDERLVKSGTLNEGERMSMLGPLGGTVGRAYWDNIDIHESESAHITVSGSEFILYDDMSHSEDWTTVCEYYQNTVEIDGELHILDINNEKIASAETDAGRIEIADATRDFAVSFSFTYGTSVIPSGDFTIYSGIGPTITLSRVGASYFAVSNGAPYFLSPGVNIFTISLINIGTWNCKINGVSAFNGNWEPTESGSYQLAFGDINPMGTATGEGTWDNLGVNYIYQYINQPVSNPELWTVLEFGNKAKVEFNTPSVTIEDDNSIEIARITSSSTISIPDNSNIMISFMFRSIRALSTIETYTIFNGFEINIPLINGYLVYGTTTPYRTKNNEMFQFTITISNNGDWNCVIHNLDTVSPDGQISGTGATKQSTISFGDQSAEGNAKGHAEWTDLIIRYLPIVSDIFVREPIDVADWNTIEEGYESDVSAEIEYGMIHIADGEPIFRAAVVRNVELGIREPSRVSFNFNYGTQKYPDNGFAIFSGFGVLITLSKDINGNYLANFNGNQKLLSPDGNHFIITFSPELIIDIGDRLTPWTDVVPIGPYSPTICFGDSDANGASTGEGYWDELMIETIAQTLSAIVPLTTDYQWIEFPFNIAPGMYSLNIEGVSADAICVDRWMLASVQDGTVISDPLSWDTDGDGLSDGAERTTYYCNPMARDTDNDGLLDSIEAMPKVGTDPWNSDTEYDFLVDGDGAEIQVIFRTNATDDDGDGNFTYGQDTWIGLPELMNMDIEFIDNFKYGMDAWSVVRGTWDISAGSLHQSEINNPNTYISSDISQTGQIDYKWKMNRVTGWGAGLQFMVNETYSYMVWHNSNKDLYLYKISTTQSQILDQVDLILLDEETWYNYRVQYNSITGLIQVYVNNLLRLSYTDPNPLQSATSIGFRTHNGEFLFDDVYVTMSLYIPTRMSNQLKTFDYLNEVTTLPSVVQIPYNSPDDKRLYFNGNELFVEIRDDIYAHYEQMDIPLAETSARPVLSYALTGQETYRNCAKTADADTDGIIDGLESAFGCSPRDRDSDDDGLSDGYELFMLGTNPGMVDSDLDGAQDGTECGVISDMIESGYWNPDVNMFIYGTDAKVFVPDADPGKTTNPVVADTDGDGLWDGWEDKDHDKEIDANERGEDIPTVSKKAHILDDEPRLWADGSVTNTGTYSVDKFESDPTNPDSDGDGLLDGADPAKRDCDADDDGLWDGPNVGNYTGEMTYRTKPTSDDTDQDGLNDGLEVSLNESKVRKDWVEFNGYTIWFTDSFTQDTDMTTHTNPLLKDSDHDGLEDGEEDANKNGVYDVGMFVHNATTKYWDCDPNDPDTDKDGLADGNEKYWGDDTDGDNWINARDKDSDGDGLEDGNETLLYLTEMVEIDSDSDGLADGHDCIVNGASYFGEMEYGTDPNVPDTDDDGLLDGVEVGVTWDMAVACGMYVWDADNGTTVTNPLAKDTDGDGLPDGCIDGWDWTLPGVVISKVNTVADLGEFEDLDCDGMLNPGTWNRVPGAGETNETNASKADTDDDTLPDADEVMIYKINPLIDGDSDGDGLSDVDEIFNIFAGIDFTGDMDLDILPNGPGDYDTDGDGLSDGTEVAMGTDPAHNDTDRDKILDGDEPRVVYRTNATNVDAFNSTATYTAWIQVDQNWSDWTWQLVNFTNSGYNLPSSTAKIIGTVIGSTPEGYNITRITESEIRIWVNVTTDYDTGAYALSSYIFTTTGAGVVQLDWISPIQAFANSSREIWGGLSPTSNDTDGDGLYDGPNVEYTYTLDGKNHRGEDNVLAIDYDYLPYAIRDDTDNDGVLDAGETWFETNPLIPDTDGDSANDGQEIFGYNLVWMSIAADGTVAEHYVNGTTSDPLDFKNIVWYDPVSKTIKNTIGNAIPGRDLDKDAIPDWCEATANTTARTDSSHPLFWYCGYDNMPWGRMYRHNWSAISNQFNPFVQENTPPIIEWVEIDTRESWGWGWTGYVCEHAWTDIDVYITEVAPYTIKIGVVDRNTYITFSGLGGQYREHHFAAIDLDYWADVALDYKVNVTAWDSSLNYVYFQKEIEGWFGGALKVLEDIWNAVVGFFEAAWEAVKSAVNFIVEWVKSIVNKTINKVIEPLLAMISNWVESMGELSSMIPSDISIQSDGQSNMITLNLFGDSNSPDSFFMKYIMQSAHIMAGLFAFYWIVQGLQTFISTILPGIGSTASLLLQGIIVVSIFTILLYLESLLPEQDSTPTSVSPNPSLTSLYFNWAGNALTVLDIILIIFAAEKYTEIPGYLHKEGNGLVLSLFGLISMLFLEPMFGDAAIIVGFVFTVFGLINTALCDIFDNPPTFSFWEELVSCMSFLYGVDKLAKMQRG